MFSNCHIKLTEYTLNGESSSMMIWETRKWLEYSRLKKEVKYSRKAKLTLFCS